MIKSFAGKLLAVGGLCNQDRPTPGLSLPTGKKQLFLLADKKGVFAD
jgi:hypothetical protein